MLYSIIFTHLIYQYLRFSYYYKRAMIVFNIFYFMYIFTDFILSDTNHV